MKITGGMLQGITLENVKGDVRPLTARIRRSLFDALSTYMARKNQTETKFLDLFAGSGIVSAEAISRNFDSCTLVEKDPIKRLHLKHTQTHLIKKTQKQVYVYIEPVERFIQGHTKSYMVIFLDPPYRYAYKSQLLHRVACSKLVNDQSLLIMHLPSKEDIIIQSAMKSPQKYRATPPPKKNHRDILANSFAKPPLESEKETAIHPPKLTIIKERRYGGAKLCYYRMRSDYWSRF